MRRNARRRRRGIRRPFFLNTGLVLRQFETRYDFDATTALPVAQVTMASDPGFKPRARVAHGRAGRVGAEGDGRLSEVKVVRSTLVGIRCIFKFADRSLIGSFQNLHRSDIPVVNS